MSRAPTLWLWLVIAGVAGSFWPVLGPELGLYYGDHSVVFRRRWFWVVDALARFELPARTIGTPNGLPMESLLNGTFTPMTGIFALGPFTATYDFFVAGHVLLLAVGAFFLARSLGAGGLLSAGAAAIALTGPFLSFENLLVGLQGFAWAPWTYWAVLEVLRGPTPRAVGGLGLAGGFHLQGIMPETCLLDALAGGLLLGVVVFHERRRVSAASLLALGGGLAVAFALAAVELMPVLEALQSTQRGTGFSHADQTEWSVSSLQLLDFLVPGLTSLHDLPFAEPQGVHGRDRAYLVSLYLGVVPVVAAIALFDARTRRWAAVLMAIALLGLLLSMGDHAFLHGPIGRLPLLRNGRYPVKFTTVTAAALAALVPLGGAVIERQVRVAAMLSALHLTLLLGLYNALGLPEVLAYVRGLVELTQVFPTVPHATKLELVAQSLGHRVAIAAIASGALAVGTVGAVALKRQAWLPVVAVVSIWFGLTLGARETVIGAPTSPPAAPEMLDALQVPRNRYVMLTPMHAYPAGPTDIESNLFGQYQRSIRLRGDLVLPRGRRWFDIDADGQSLPISTEASLVLAESKGPPAERLLGRLGISWVSNWVPKPWPGRVEVPILDEAPQYLYPLPQVRAPLSVHARWLRRGEEVAALGPDLWSRLMDARNFDVIVVAGEGAPAPATTSSVAAASCEAATTVVGPEDTAVDTLSVAVDAACPVILLVLEPWSEQWRARVDGVSEPVLIGDIGALAVAVPKGPHTVEFEFVAHSKRWLPLSSGALVLASILLALGRRRRSDAGPG